MAELSIPMVKAEDEADQREMRTTEKTIVPVSTADPETTTCEPRTSYRDPRSLSLTRKWAIAVVMSIGSNCVTCASSLYTTTYVGMEAEFGNSRIVSTLGLTLWVLGAAIASLVVGLSEFYGRRPVVVVSYLLFVVWFIPSGVAQNISTMLVARFFNGCAGAVFLSVAGGAIGDVFDPSHLGPPMAIYSASPIMGPAVGPILGGFINYFAPSWRWSYWILIAYSGVILIALVVIVPETYVPVLKRAAGYETAKQSNHSSMSTFGRSLYRPFLLLFLDPMCASLCLLSAVILGILYLFFGAFNLVFSTVYGFNMWQQGLVFTGLLMGMVFAVLSDSYWRRNYRRVIARNGGVAEPEFRLIPSIAGSWFCVVGVFWFAWTTYSSIHWIVPIIATSFFGFGTILTFTGVFTFFVQAFPLYAASALGANGFARSVFGGIFPLFALQMYNKLGIHWATTLLGFITLIMAPFPYIIFIYGKKLRSKSRFVEGH